MLKGVQLKNGERLVHVQRGVLVRFVPVLLLGSLLLIAPWFFFFLVLPFGWLGLAPVFASTALGLFLLLRVRARWHGTVCVLTTRRVIQVRRGGFIEEEVRSVSTKDVRDVAYRIHGIFGKLVRVGSVRVRFKGVAPSMRFDHMRRPDHLHELIRELMALPKRAKTGSAKFQRVSIEELEA